MVDVVNREQHGVDAAMAGSTTRDDNNHTNETSPSAEGRNEVPVTSEDLAQPEDICFDKFGDVGTLDKFGDVGTLIKAFPCTLGKKVATHGTLFVTEQGLCFYANSCGLETKMSLRHEDVARCVKGNSALIVPNAIVVEGKSGQDFVFRRFWERDACYSLLEKLRVEAVRNGQDLIEEASVRHGPLSPPRREGSRPSSVPPPARARAGAGAGAGDGDGGAPAAPSSLPCSPIPSARRTWTSPFRRPSASSSSSSSPLAVAVSETRRPESGLIVLAPGEPEIPSPRHASSTSQVGGEGSDVLSPLRGPRSMGGLRTFVAAANGANANVVSEGGRDRHQRACSVGDTGMSGRLGNSGRRVTVGVGAVGVNAAAGESKDDVDVPDDGTKRGMGLWKVFGRNGSRRRGSGDSTMNPEIVGNAVAVDAAMAAAGNGRTQEDVGVKEDRVADWKAMEEAVAECEGQTEISTANFDISVREFYDTFFGDNAPHGLPNFHTTRGDSEMDAGEWQQFTGRGEGGEGMLQGTAGAGSGGLTRTLRFGTPIKVSWMATAGHVRTQKRQRAKFFGRSGCIVDTVTTVLDRLPYCDTFHVEDRWAIRPAGEEGTRCTATVTWRVVWYRYIMPRRLVENKCTADTNSFNVAFVEGMKQHLAGRKSTAVLNGRPNVGVPNVSVGRTASRGRSPTPRGRLASPVSSNEGSRVARSASAVNVQGRRKFRVGELLRRSLFPIIRVFSLLFVLYMAAFWTLGQVRYGLTGGGFRMGRRRGDAAGPGAGTSKQDLMALYGEWGRSSLALLDLRDETRRLSSEIVQLGRTRESQSRGRPKGSDWSKLDDKMLLQLLQEVDDKVTALSRRADLALGALNITASQIRDASTCPILGDCGAEFEEGCDVNVVED